MVPKLCFLWSQAVFFSSRLCFLEAQAVFFHVCFHYKIKAFCAQAVFFKFQAVFF